MDTSKKYVKMSELSGLSWKPEAGNWYYDKRFKRVSIVIEKCLLPENVGIFDEFKRDFVPLFLQDQLQDMVKDNYEVVQDLIHRFHEVCFFGDGGDFNTMDYDSMEQLWLAFLLAEKYNKYWDGTNWVDKK